MSPLDLVCSEQKRAPLSREDIYKKGICISILPHPSNAKTRLVLASYTCSSKSSAKRLPCNSSNSPDQDPAEGLQNPTAPEIIPDCLHRRVLQ